MLLFLDPLIRAIRWPIDFVRSQVFGVKSIKSRAQMDVQRLKGAVGEYGQAVGGAGGQPSAQQTPKKKKKKKKMGLFSSKKKCPSCGQKLHASWDQCPYCGWNEKGAAAAPAPAAAPKPAPMAAPMPSGGKQRTVALDMSGGAAAQQGGMSLGWLVPVEGESTGEVFQLKPRSVVGSSAQCDIVLRDTGISGRHAEILFQGGGFKINDLGSTNGTFVNDKRVTTSDLFDNDSVRLGMTNFKFKSL